MHITQCITRAIENFAAGLLQGIGGGIAEDFLRVVDGTVGRVQCLIYTVLDQIAGPIDHAHGAVNLFLCGLLGLSHGAI